MQILAPSSVNGLWRTVAAIIVTAVAVSCLSACGDAEGPVTPAKGTSVTETYDEDAPAPEDRCPGGPTEPLKIGTVIEVGRRHGFTLYPDPACIPDPTIVSQASNILLYGPHTNSQQEDEISRREGSVKCLLRARAGSPTANKVERVRYAGDDETHFRLLNVDCIIYPDPENAGEQLARLQKAMDELEERSGPS